MKKLRILSKFIKGNITIYILAVIFSGIAVLISIFNPLVIKFSVDSVIGTEPMQIPEWLMGRIMELGGREVLLGKLWICGIVYVLLTLAAGIFQYIKGRWVAVSTENAAKSMRNTLYDHLQHMEYSEHVKSQTGDLLQRCTHDVETVRNFTAGQMPQVGEILFTVILTLITMLSMNIKLTMISLCIVPFIFIASLIFFTKVKKTFREVELADAEMSTVLQENLTGVRVVRAFGRQCHEIDKFKDKNAKHREQVRRLINLMSMYWSFSDFLCMTQAAVVLFFSIYWTIEGVISLGTMIAFMAYVKNLLWPIRQLGRIISDMGQAFISLDRIIEILDKPVEGKTDNGKKPEISGSIVFDRVSFQYPDGTCPIKDISFKAEKGQTVGILGPTGCGKSSMVHLMVRLFDYQEGSILIDGHELKDINKKWLRRHIGIVLQEPFLFSKTVLENIRIAKPNASLEEIYEAAKIAVVHDSIVSFENGYETMVGERGVTLSGGQMQRVAIARTVLKDHPILVFDDSLSAVDMETDLMIRKALEDRSRNATTFIISHRINTLAQADFIIVIDDGRIAERGTHRELIERDGFYSRVWAIQSELEQEQAF